MPKRSNRLNAIERFVRNKRKAIAERRRLSEMAEMYGEAAAEASRRFDAYGSTRLPPGLVYSAGQGVYGRGKYSLGKLSRTAAGKNIGRALIKRAVGMISGRGAYVSGQGEYTPNSLMSSAPPQVISSAADETGAVTVSRLEFLTEIYGPASGSFALQQFNINPGLEKSFPWLSQIAQNYDEYEMLQLVYSFRSTTTDIGTTSSGQVGTVLMATSYSPDAAPFSDKKEMMAYDGAMSCKSTENMVHGVECDPSKLSGSQGKHIRAFGLDQSKDIKDYDHGIFQIAIANAPSGFANQSIGELWVSYTVKLRKPKFFSARGLNISRDIFVSQPTGLTLDNWMGDLNNVLTGLCNNIGCVLTKPATNAIRVTFPNDFAGVVEIKVLCEGQSFVNYEPTSWAASSSTIVLYRDMYGSYRDGVAATAPAGWAGAFGANNIVHITRWQVTPSAGGTANFVTITMNASGASGTIQQSSIEINEINPGFSYRYANIAPSVAPILVNPAGSVIQP